MTTARIGDHFGYFPKLQIHDRTMVQRERSAPYFLHLCGLWIARESSSNECLFLQSFGVFTLNGAGAKIVGDFGHRFFASLSLRLGLSLRLLRRRFSVLLCFLGVCVLFLLRLGRGLDGWRDRLLCARNKNPRQGGLLIRRFVLLVIVLDVGVANLAGIFLQRPAQFLRENLHAREVYLRLERRAFVEAAFFRRSRHPQHARISGCELPANGRRHFRLQRFGELFKLLTGDHCLTGAALRGGIGAEIIQSDHRIIGTNFNFGCLIGGGGNALFRL